MYPPPPQIDPLARYSPPRGPVWPWWAAVVIVFAAVLAVGAPL